MSVSILGIQVSNHYSWCKCNQYSSWGLGTFCSL